MRGTRQSRVDSRQSRVESPSRQSIVVSFVALLGLFALPEIALAQQYTFEQVAAGLKYPDAATRIKAIGMLRDAQYPEAAAAIGSVLTDPDDRVQLTAIDAVRSLFMTRPVERRRRIGFVVEVRDSSTWEEAFAAGPTVLVPKTVPVEVLTGLVDAIQDAHPRVRVEALYAFGMLAPLGDASSSSAGSAGAAIENGLGWTLEALRRGDRMLQVAAVQVAGRILENCGQETSDPAASSCATVGNALIDAINSRDAAVRRASMQALGQLRYGMAEQALSDQFSYYQRGPDAAAALIGLAGIGHQASVSRFRELLGSSDANFRRLAVEGIARSGDKSLQPDLDRLGQTERSAPVLLALHYASVRLGAAGAPDQLVASLRDPALRQQAQYYLLDLSRSIRSIAQALARFLQDPNADTRATVADVLGFSGDTQAIPALEAATRDADPSASAAAQRAVERIKKGSNVLKF